MGQKKRSPVLHAMAQNTNWAGRKEAQLAGTGQPCIIYSLGTREWDEGRVKGEPQVRRAMNE